MLRPVLPRSNRLVTGSFSHAVSPLPWLRLRTCSERRQTCWEHLLGSLPLFLSLLPSLHASLATSLLNLSLPFLLSASIFPSLRLLSSVSPSPLCPITGVTAAELSSKHSRRCWSTLHTVMCRLCITQDVVRMTLLGWHVSPEDIMFTLFVFTGNRHLHFTWASRYCRSFVIAFQKGMSYYYENCFFHPPPLVLRFAGNVGVGFWQGWRYLWLFCISFDPFFPICTVNIKL